MRYLFLFFFCRGAFQGVKCVGRSNQIPLEKSPRDSGIVFFFFKGKARTTPKEVNIALAVTNEAHWWRELELSAITSVTCTFFRTLPSKKKRSYDPKSQTTDGQAMRFNLVSQLMWRVGANSYRVRHIWLLQLSERERHLASFRASLKEVPRDGFGCGVSWRTRRKPATSLFSSNHYAVVY